MTVEEKAFRDKIDRVELEELMYDEFYELIAEVKNVGRRIGYNEAMRWHNPDVDPPMMSGSVLVKYETARGKIKYGIARYLNLGFGNPWTVEGSTSRKIIGWRPIEEDSL